MRANKATESKIHPQMLKMLELLSLLYMFTYIKKTQKREQEIRDYVFERPRRVEKELKRTSGSEKYSSSLN